MPTLERLTLTLRRHWYRIGRSFTRRFRAPKTLYVWHRVPYYRQLWQEACDLRDLQLIELKHDTWDVRDQDNLITRINNCYLELDNPVTLDTAGNKYLTYQLLQQHHLPVAPHCRFTLNDLGPMRQFIDSREGPFVIKPSYGTGSGIGVTTHLRSVGECTRAAVLASLACPEMLIEQQVIGEVYRLLFLGDTVIAASRRTGVWVTGDGQTSIRDLYTAQRPATVTLASWLADTDFITTLKAQHMTVDDVPPSSLRILVKSSAKPMSSTTEIRTVYDEDALGSLAPAILDDACAAANALRSEFCGVDIITCDPARPLRETGGVIGEVNTTPGVHHHYKLNDETSIHIGATVLDYVVRKAKSRQPTPTPGA